MGKSKCETKIVSGDFCFKADQSCGLTVICELTIDDPQAAELEVCGFSVFERNCKSLLQKDFQPIMNRSAKITPKIRALCERYHIELPAFGLLSENDFSEAPKTKWRGDFQYGLTVPGSGDSPHALNVSSLLQQASPKKVQRYLAKKLFQEIYDSSSGWITRLLNKKISFPLTRFLVKTPLTPNQITFFCFAIGLMGCFLLLSQSWATRIFGAIFLQLSSIVDGCDGEVARLKLMRTKRGAWLDTVSDDILNNALLVCLYLGYFWQTQNQFVFVFGLATTFASLGVSFFLYHDLLSKGKVNAADYQLAWQKKSNRLTTDKTFFDLVKPILKRDFFIFVAMILIFLDYRLILIGLFSVVWVAFVLYLISFFYGVRNVCHDK